MEIEKHDQPEANGLSATLAHAVTPILNVSDIEESFAWFEKLGWKKGFDWGTPPSFGSVSSGKCEIFLCVGGQGGRDARPLPAVQTGDDQTGSGVWMSIWVGDVDAVHRRCLEQGIEVTFPPTNEPWGVREMHVRHPDGHVFRISKGTGPDEEG
jgi:catechol 2,3-dioxygenase-like lactoylglutathione lyase family enzyme